MTQESIHRILSERESREIDTKVRKQVLEACILDEDNRLIRGYVDRVTCDCGTPRFDDGTRCKNCGRYYKHTRRNLAEDTLS